MRAAVQELAQQVDINLLIPAEESVLQLARLSGIGRITGKLHELQLFIMEGKIDPEPVRSLDDI